MRLSLVADKEPLDLIEDNISDQKVQDKINELRKRHPTAADILERVHDMDLKKLHWQHLLLIQWRGY